MTKRRLITQSDTKRVTAAALAEAKSRNRWSNADAGDALGCAEGTIRNRLDADCSKHQMTVHELVRSIDADGPGIANAILGPLVDHRAVPIVCDTAPDAIEAAGRAARCAADLIAAGADGIDADEARALIQPVVDLQATMAGLEVRLRAIVQGGPVRAIST